MLEQAITEWREAALAEERAQAMARECASVSRFAAWRFGSEAGGALAALLANEDDFEQLDRVSDLPIDCANADELLRRTRSVMLHRDGP